jgi:UDP-N-acetylmuramyl pentapeptide phosphotransferase/UDP-N-acetylglucosamine-1-phosphate transferase
MLQISLSFVVSYALLLALLKSASRRFFLDHPNHRSLHHNAVPRFGGVVIFIVAIGMAVIVLLQWGRGWNGSLVSAVLLLAAVSVWDDLHDLSSALRLIVQLICAVLLLLGLELSFASWWFSLVVVFIVIWSINLYNFMDGMDGLAAFMAIIGFSTLGLMGWLSADQYFAQLLFILVASVSGFLVHNFPPAKVFMGDVGSTFLGLVMAAASIYGVKALLFPWWIPMIVFMPFWLDATVTLLRRVFRGERFWEAHREHVYQRLVLSGMSVRKVLLLESVLMLLCSVVAIGLWYQWRL